MLQRILLYVFLFSTLLSCQNDNLTLDEDAELMAAINSASVAFAYSSPELQSFLANPDRAYVSSYFRFEEDLAEDIIFGLDIEWIEGVDNPIHVRGGDWMSLAGVTRNGLLYFPIGSPENLEGIPTDTDNWIVKDLGIVLQPDTWYKMTVVCDFGKREFVSFRIEGDGVAKSEDISGYPLEYPNYIPIDKPCLTFYNFALRGKEFAPDNAGGTKVYFDKVEGGIWQENSFKVVFQNGFENQSEIAPLPITLPVTPLSDLQENFWYFENDDAKINITSDYAFEGNKSIVCHASLVK